MPCEGDRSISRLTSFASPEANAAAIALRISGTLSRTVSKLAFLAGVTCRRTSFSHSAMIDLIFDRSALASSGNLRWASGPAAGSKRAAPELRLRLDGFLRIGQALRQQQEHRRAG